MHSPAANAQMSIFRIDEFIYVWKQAPTGEKGGDHVANAVCVPEHMQTQECNPQFLGVWYRFRYGYFPNVVLLMCIIVYPEAHD